VSAQKLRIGSRGSQLALWQANHVAGLLRARGLEVEIEIIKTTGDRMQEPEFLSTMPPDADSKGIFIKEIEEALTVNKIDLAVHSLKDLPTELAPQFSLAAVLERADARDVLVCVQERTLTSLPANSRIGTTSPRRQAQLRVMQPELQFVEVRGNVDTRLRKLAEGHADALVLAAAGLDRLQGTEWVRQIFSPDELCPAPGQGALALECRAGDAATQQAVAFLDHAPTRYAVTAERLVLHQLGGGCSLPVGVYCELRDDRPRLYAAVAHPRRARGSKWMIAQPAGTSAEALAAEMVERMLTDGAREMLS